MVRIVVNLERNRDFCGALTLEDEIGTSLLGPFPVAGRSSNAPAEIHRNSVRNPQLRYGDTPTGRYRFSQILTGRDRSRFGPGIIVLEPISGDAALAEANGRSRFFIQGGTSGPGGALRSTSGALRLSDEHMQALLFAIDGASSKNLNCLIQESGLVAAPSLTVFVDNGCDDEDPPHLQEIERPLSGQIAGDLSRRDVLRSSGYSAVGIIALNLAVSFIALGGLTSGNAHAETAYGEPEDPAETPSEPPSTPEEPSVSAPSEPTPEPPSMEPLSPADQSELRDAPNDGGGVQLNPGAREGAESEQVAPVSPSTSNAPAPSPLTNGGTSGAQLNNAAGGSLQGAEGTTGEQIRGGAAQPFDNNQGGSLPSVQTGTSTVVAEPPPAVVPSAKEIYFNEMKQAGQISDPVARQQAVDKANNSYFNPKPPAPTTTVAQPPAAKPPTPPPAPVKPTINTTKIEE